MKRVLIVDDSATVRLYHRGILEDAGYFVDEAWNGEEALEMAREEPFDLLLIDVDMPKLDGFALLSELRRHQPPHPPAILVSTEPAARNEMAAYRAGASCYLLKPVRRLQLVAYSQLLMGEAPR
jgi:two-component system chemotaxis response regulator CheY